MSAIATDEGCLSLLFHAWYQDDGVITGPSCLFPEHFPLSRKEGPHIRSAAKCELFSLSDLSTGPSIMKKSILKF